MSAFTNFEQITQDMGKQWHDCAAPFRTENHRDLRRIASRHAACVVGSNDRFHRAADDCRGSWGAGSALVGRYGVSARLDDLDATVGKVRRPLWSQERLHRGDR